MSFPLALAPSGAGLVGNLSFDSESRSIGRRIAGKPQ